LTTRGSIFLTQNHVITSNIEKINTGLKNSPKYVFVKMITAEGRENIVGRFSFVHIWYYLQHACAVPIASLTYYNTAQHRHDFIECALFHRFIHQWFYSPSLSPGLLFSFVISFTQTVRAPWMRAKSLARPLHDNTNRINAHIDIYALTGIQTHIPVFERTKTVHALDCTATVIGRCVHLLYICCVCILM
jgi:hypothetical protein